MTNEEIRRRFLFDIETQSDCNVSCYSFVNCQLKNKIIICKLLLDLGFEKIKFSDMMLDNKFTTDKNFMVEFTNLYRNRNRHIDKPDLGMKMLFSNTNLLIIKNNLKGFLFNNDVEIFRSIFTNMHNYPNYVSDYDSYEIELRLNPKWFKRY